MRGEKKATACLLVGREGRSDVFLARKTTRRGREIYFWRKINIRDRVPFTIAQNLLQLRYNEYYL